MDIPSYFYKENYDFEKDRARILKRYERLIDNFKAKYDKKEFFIARAPGRINLIGEHTDYNGLPVLPMAVNRDIASVFSPIEDAKVILNNTDSSFTERQFYLEASIPPYNEGDWGNYCKAAVQGVIDHYRVKGKTYRDFKGLQIMLDGDIPSAAGLSSSSALVVLSALIFLKSNSLEIPKLELAGLMARAEHYVGTQGGGMDQAVSLLGKADHALKIDFNPLKVTPVKLPPGYKIVAADSLVQAAKSEGALDQYNRRAIECRLAAAVLRKKFSEMLKRELPIRLIGDLNTEKLDIPEDQIRELAEGILHRQPYSLSEIAALLEMKPIETAKRYCKKRDGSIFPEPAEGFKLKNRYRHVTAEGKRVEGSFKALQENNMYEFGNLMNQSHASCRDLYEISCPELDKLVEISRESGALGSRLTGAGFGGCTISLLESDKVEAFINRLIQLYYRDFLNIKQEDYSPYIFSCKAVNGADVLS